MLIAVTCPQCEYRFKVHARYAGKRGRCPNPECRGEYSVPDEAATSTPAAVGDARKPVRVRQAPQPKAERVERADPRAVRAEVVRREVPVEPERIEAAPQPAVAPMSVGSATGSPDSTRPVRDRPKPSRRKEVSSSTRPRVSPQPSPRVQPAPSPPSTSVPTTPKPSPWRRRGTVTAGAVLGLTLLVAGGMGFLGKGEGDEVAGAGTDPGRSDADVAAELAARDAKLTDRFGKEVAPFLTKYCVDCHGKVEPEAGLDVTAYHDVKSVRDAREKWEDVVGMLRISAMPPADHDPQPTRDERTATLAWLDEALGVDCRIEHDPGRVTIRRLNRTEYTNTIRDLVGVDVDPAKDFPSDDVGEGFDNIADVLTLPPLLLEKYVDAAEQITTAAIDVDAFAPYADAKQGDELRGARAGEDGFLGLASSGEITGEFRIPSRGRYTIRVEAQAEQAGDENAKFELRIDGKTVKTFETNGYRKPAFHETTTTLESGRVRIAARFINDFYNPDAENRRDRDRNLYVRRIEVKGEPGNEPDLWRSHRELIVARPGDDLSVRDAAIRVLRRFAKRAFRRPVDDEEITRFVDLVEMVVENGDSYERGIQVAVTGVLVSPHFLFRVERDRDPNDPNAMRDVGDWELASRLSYFLWSTMPDDELFRLAEEGRLHEPKVLEAQVRRMLKDERSRALVENFGGQWLNLGQLEGLIPDPDRFPDFSDDLREDMRRETLAFLTWIVEEDRSVLDLIDARTAFVNERLAKHYGIDGVQGNHLRQVSLDGLPRAGVLTQGSILLLTSNPDRTSPVKRGKWIMENMLGTPPPEPPPNVPTLEESKKANPNLTLREQLEIHRRNPVCNSCHEQMDALGFGFENFDAVGRYRTKDEGNPVDSSGTLPSGESFEGPIELVAVLKKQRDQFTENLARKMLTYGLGRGLEYYDDCAIETITANLAKDDHRFSRLVLEVVRSDPFLKRRGDGDQP